MGEGGWVSRTAVTCEGLWDTVTNADGRILPLRRGAEGVKAAGLRWLLMIDTDRGPEGLCRKSSSGSSQPPALANGADGRDARWRR